jgi:hypothetical protein
MTFNVETSASLPEMPMELDKTMTTTARPDAEPLVPANPSLAETSMEPNPMTFNETSASLPEMPMELDTTTTTARPDPEAFVDSGLPEEPPTPAPSSKPIKFNGFDLTSAPQAAAYRRKVQPSLSRSPTPHSDMQKYERAKRLRNQVQPSLSRSPTPHSDMQKYERAKRLRNQDTNVTDETQAEKAM